MKTVYILVRYLDSTNRVDSLAIGRGQFRRIAQNATGRGLIERCRELFPGAYAQFSDWLYERPYVETPPARIGNDPSGYGDIPFQSEDLLLALRLSQPGDISFVAQALVDDDGRAMLQQPYRYFGAIASTRPYFLDVNQIPVVEQILRLVRTPAADSAWFSVAKRFFLYGGAKEFSPYQAELDRILDYAVALEAVLMFEHDFINRLLKRRTVSLLGLAGEQAARISRLLNDFYGYRSTIAHGDPLPIADAAAFRGQMWLFEGLVRDVLRTALQSIPADDAQRKQRLRDLAIATDAERLEQLARMASRLDDSDLRRRVLEALQPNE